MKSREYKYHKWQRIKRVKADALKLVTYLEQHPVIRHYMQSIAYSSSKS